MISMGRLGSYIASGVCTISGSFHPFGGAVDIIVVEQPDGSLRSSPWYVRFGKFQGVLGTKERIVRVHVNGAEADFHMCLDYRGRTYFLKEIEEEATTCPPVVEENKKRMLDRRRRFASKSCDFDAIALKYNDSYGEKSEGRKPWRSLTFDRTFGRKLTRRKNLQEEEGGCDVERENSLERAQIVAELLDVNWSTGLPMKKCTRNSDPQLSTSNDMDNSVVSSNHEAGESNLPVENGESTEDVRRKLACPTDSKEQVVMHYKSFSGSNSDKKMESLPVGISKDFVKTDGLPSFSHQDKSKSSATGSHISRVNFSSTALENQILCEVMTDGKVSGNIKLKKQKKDADKKLVSQFTRNCNRVDTSNSFINQKSCNNTVGVNLPSGCIPVKGTESNPLCRKCGLSGMCSKATERENEEGNENNRKIQQTSESVNDTKSSYEDAMRIATVISSWERLMDKEYSEHYDSKLDDAKQMYPILKDSLTKSRCFSFPATYCKEALKPLVVNNKSCICSDDSSTDDSSIDAQTSNTNLREIAIPINIAGSHSVDIGNNVRRVESFPNMLSHYDYQDELILHYPLSRSLDSNSKFLKLSLVHREGFSHVKFDSGKECHSLQRQVDVDCAESLKGKINISGDPTSERASSGPISCEGIGDHAPSQTTQEECLDVENSPKQKVIKRFIRTLTPTSEQIASLNLKEGSNTVSFTLSSSILGLQQVEARIYLWKWNHRIVISDVDGTITKSDVLGQFMPLVGVDWSQTGVARLFSAIKENGYQLLFLSARALCQAYLTKRFLFNLKQDGKALPDGPVVISPDGLFPSLYREVIRRVPHEFKIACLEDIKQLFPCECNPFYAGFGNRDTDEFSYLKVGIPKGKIFIINPKGEVAVNRHVNTKSYTSLHDLVNGMFPAMASSEQEDYNAWNFWKLPPPTVDF